MLRLSSAVLLLAWLAIFLPVDWMAARYRKIIVYVGCMNVVLGVLVLGIDIHAGMPEA